MTCVLNCAVGYFRNGALKECTACPAGCLTCLGAQDDSCLSCTAGYFLTQDGRCLAQCPGGLFGSSLEQRCVQECPALFYEDAASRLCLSCDPLCRFCLSAAPDSCLTCAAQGHYLEVLDAVSSSGRCAASCPSSGLYPDNLTLRCEPCSARCARCTNRFEHSCLECRSGFFLHQGSCLEACPELRFFPDPASKTCEKCHASCLSCSGPSAQDCLSCGDYNFRHESSCLLTCPPAFFQDLAAKACAPCAAGCAQCADASLASCTRCALGYYLSSTCSATCPDGTFRNE